MNQEFYSKLYKLISDTNNTDNTENINNDKNNQNENNYKIDNINDNKYIDNNSNRDNNNTNIELCLISSEPLKSDHVTLECNHKFNYKNIYKEVKKQQYFSKDYVFPTRIDKGVIMCPYCRNIQKKLLPHNPKYKDVLWVNTLINNTINNDNKSDHKSKIKNDLNNQIINGKNTNEKVEICQVILHSGNRKGQMCGRNKSKCQYHNKS